MLWFYVRDQQSLTVETPYDNDTREYVAIIMGATGVPQSTHFKSTEAFRACLLALEHDLTAQSGRRTVGRISCLTGWPDRKLER
jgi:hypothetical protein